jgi:hypothetical protein
MLVAVILSNIISVKSTIEGLTNKDESDSDSEDKDNNDDDKDKKAAPRKKVARKKAAANKKAGNKTLQEILNGQNTTTNQTTEIEEAMAPIDYKMSKDV